MHDWEIPTGKRVRASQKLDRAGVAGNRHIRPPRHADHRDVAGGGRDFDGAPRAEAEQLARPRCFHNIRNLETMHD